MINFAKINKDKVQEWLAEHYISCGCAVNHLVDEEGYHYVDDDNCTYEDMAAFIISGFFDFCGCGDPESALVFIRDRLDYINWRMEKIRENSGPAFDDAWKEIKEKETSLFGSIGGAYFFYYWASKEELTEHGGSVPGWLTEKGNIVLELLNIAIEKEKIND